MSRLPPMQNLLRIILEVGQSNVRGRDANNAYRTSRDLDDQIMIYEHGGSVGAIVETDWKRLSDSTTPNGPERGFARRLARETQLKGGKIGIVKVYYNGTALSHFYADSDYWTAIQSAIDTAIANAQAMGWAVRVEGLIWLHGNEDAKSLSLANVYDAGLLALIAGYRAQWAANGSADMWVALADHPASWASATYASTVRAAMASVQAADPKAVIVPTTDTADVGDATHYDAASTELIGIRMADALIAAGYESN